MRTDKLVEQLELYSNAILSFLVAQSLAFSFTFGTNPSFACVVIREKSLAAGLLAHFIVSTVLAVFAVNYLSGALRRLSRENSDLVRVVFIAKSVAIALFALIPIFLLIKFGLLEPPNTGRCKPPVEVSRTATVSSVAS